MAGNGTVTTGSQTASPNREGMVETETQWITRDNELLVILTVCQANIPDWAIAVKRFTDPNPSRDTEAPTEFVNQVDSICWGPSNPSYGRPLGNLIHEFLAPHGVDVKTAVGIVRWLGVCIAEMHPAEEIDYTANGAYRSPPL